MHVYIHYIYTCIYMHTQKPGVCIHICAYHMCACAHTGVLIAQADREYDGQIIIDEFWQLMFVCACVCVCLYKFTNMLIDSRRAFSLSSSLSLTLQKVAGHSKMCAAAGISEYDGSQPRVDAH